MKIKPMGITGLHLGLDSLTVARVRGGGIRRYGRAALPAGTMGDGTPDMTGLEQAIRQAAQAAGVKGGACAISISHPEVVVRTPELPAMPPDALEMNLSEEMGQFLSRSPGEYIIRYKLLGGTRPVPGKPLNLMAVAVPREWLETVIAATQAAGFTVKAIDCAENARAKLLMRVPDFEQVRTAVLDIGRTLSQITIYHCGRYQISRYLYTGLEIPEEGRLIWNATHPAAIATRAEADRLCAEVASVVDYDFYSGGRVRLSQVYLCGQAALSPGLDTYLSNALELPVAAPMRGDETLILAGDALAATLREVSA